MFTLLKRKLKGAILAIFQYLKACQNEEYVDLLPMVPGCRTRITDEEGTQNKKAFSDFLKE